MNTAARGIVPRLESRLSRITVQLFVNQRISCLLLMAVCAAGLSGQTETKQTVTEFMGHKVILVEPKRDVNGFADESYRVCFDAMTPAWHCFVPSRGFYPYSFDAELVPVDLGPGGRALSFSATGTAGGSGSVIYLDPKTDSRRTCHGAFA